MIGYGHIGDILGNPVLYNLGDSQGARVYYRKAIALGEEIHDADPNDSTAKFDLAAGLVKLGMVDAPASGMAESLAVLQRSATMLEHIVAGDPTNLPRTRMLALAREYEGHRLRSLSRYRQAITSYRRSVMLCDGMLAADPADREALSQAVASSRGMATAKAMAGDRIGALRQARATITRAEGGVNFGTDKRIRQRYLAESTIELGSIYEILAKRSPFSQQRQDWEAARSALLQAIALLDGIAAGGTLLSVDATDLHNAQNLLAEAEGHLSISRPSGP
jgi:tetratricopeptide (TPR) repeat protein